VDIRKENIMAIILPNTGTSIIRKNINLVAFSDLIVVVNRIMVKFLSGLLERPLKIGTILQNRYNLIRFIGKGSYGMVYLALDDDTGNKVIVKQHRERKGKNSKEMLEHEAQTLSLLDHPSIPKYIHFFQENQTSFLVMDYMEGKNFEDLVLNEGQIYDEKESLEILLKVLNVVTYLHDNKLIHRDLRLPNIITKDNQVFVIDFGLAVFGEDKETTPTTHSSAEKELFREKSYRSDYYALGHFLLFLLYSNFESTSKKEKSWEEELIISNGTKKMIKKLLRIEHSYDHISEIVIDLEDALRGL
jgi:serine/threonine protein kinase, bacterial